MHIELYAKSFSTLGSRVKPATWCSYA